MASCVLRKVANPQIFRYLSKNAASINVVKRQTRKIHSTPFVLQKYFTEKHEWVDVPEGSTQGTVGITDYAQDKLGEVVYVQLPEKGDSLEADGEAGVLESVKAASDIYSPVTGEVTDVNQAVADNPKAINDSPYEDGWLFKLTLSSPSELENLMNEESYEEYLKTCD
ncbi:glycine cleavage system H protein, mitochondrial-like [Mercenaria mercenaria]|uniref:glycine cleavage system H protein, mitochondrial-like n=1 Tax=Mercenaria mercenaria TaxID=6596 RepID=UPI00234FAA2B|nr:glycine cleavage system H protein, mitochondrial-like [Mercenaria mercenaria]